MTGWWRHHRPRALAGALLPLLVVAGGGLLAGCDLWKERKAPMRPTMTLTQAQQRVEQIVDEAAAQLPAGSTVKRDGQLAPVACEGRAGLSQSGQVSVDNKYKIEHPEPWPTREIIGILDRFWKSRGYRVVRDDRDDPTIAVLSVEDPKDRMRVGVKLYPRENGTADAYLIASSPCVWPDGTPPPGA